MAGVVALSATDARAGADKTFSLETRVLVTNWVGFGEGGGTYCAWGDSGSGGSALVLGLSDGDEADGGDAERGSHRGTETGEDCGE